MGPHAPAAGDHHVHTATLVFCHYFKQVLHILFMCAQVLMVLLQQNCITTRLQPSEVLVTGIKPAVHLYEADLDQMLQLIRCAKLLARA
jgi:hypothetical protein